jgi:hypothetical protein
MRQRGCGGCAAWAAAAALCVAVGCGEERGDPATEIEAAPDVLPSHDDDGGAGSADGGTTGGEDAGGEEAGGDAGWDGAGSDSAHADAGAEQVAAGDRCQEALVVDLSHDDQVSVAGDQDDFTHRWNAQDRPGCSLYDGEPAGKTEGPEIFLRLTGHAADERVEFDAEGGGTTFAFYLLEGCEATSCMGSGVFDEQVDNRFVWQASTDADIWIVAEVFGPPRDRPFEIVVRRVD